MIALGNHWICQFAANKVTYSLQYHADQDPDELIGSGRSSTGQAERAFAYQRKSNSGNLNGRNWRSSWGVLTVRSSDTQFRARLQAWIDRVQDGWLDSIHPDPGV